MSFIKERVFNPVYNKVKQFFCFLIFIAESQKKKFGCRILSIPIINNSPLIKFSVLYKQIFYKQSPKEILEDIPLLSRFSQVDSAIIGLLTSVDLADEKDKQATIDKIKNAFPKLVDLFEEKHNGNSSNSNGENKDESK